MRYFYETLSAALIALVITGATSADTLEEYPLEPDPFASEADAEPPQVFITPARMASSFLDSPNAVTSLDVSTLRKLGITEMVDAMRLVPGMMVSETHGSDVSVGYHGANVNVPRRSEVLYNSNRLHRPGYAGAHWYRLPIDLQDLNYIEVVRGPSSEYGTNAMTSTVNLIQDTVATRGVYGSFRIGDASTKDAFINGGWLNGDTQLGLRYFHRENDGFDSSVTSGSYYKNDVYTDSLMLNLEHRLNGSWVLDVAGSYAKSDYEVPAFGDLAEGDLFDELDLNVSRPSPSSREYSGFLSSKLHGVIGESGITHEVTAGINYSNFSRDQILSQCGNNFAYDPRIGEVDDLPSVHLHVGDLVPFLTAMLNGNLVLEHSLLHTPTPDEQTLIDDLGPYLQQYGFSLLESRCGTTDQDLDEDRVELNAHIVSHFSQSLQNAMGISLTHNEIESLTYLHGTVRQDSFQLYDTLRYSPTERLVLNGTLSLEGADNVDSSDAFSYRLAANYQFRPNWVLRLMHAHSERLPDVYETSRHWNYFTVYDEGEIDHLGRTESWLLRTSLSPDDLDPETLDATEIGLSYHVFSRLKADAKIFYEEYDDLISEPFNYVDFFLSNDGELKNKGVEFGLQHSMANGLEWGASYTYLDAESDTPFELSLRPDHSGSLWAILPLGRDTSISGVYYSASDVANGSYDRFDFTLMHQIPFNRGHLDLQVNYRRYPDGINAFTELSPDNPHVSLIDGRDRVFFSASISFF